MENFKKLPTGITAFYKTQPSGTVRVEVAQRIVHTKVFHVNGKVATNI